MVTGSNRGSLHTQLKRLFACQLDCTNRRNFPPIHSPDYSSVVSISLPFLSPFNHSFCTCLQKIPFISDLCEEKQYFNSRSSKPQGFFSSASFVRTTIDRPTNLHHVHNIVSKDGLWGKLCLT